ncbi:MAG: isoprenyl transferase [Sedimentisphaeraceae bacterium JB056]
MPQSQEQKRIETAQRLRIPVDKVPRHIGIVMDGNGRWAKKRMMPRFIGHREGGKNVEDIVLGANDLGIECLSLYSFSLQNWKRPVMEVDFLMHLFTRYLVSMRELMMSNNIRLKHLGRRDGLPDTLLFEMDKTIEMTSSNTGMYMALALNYGGREEIVDAVKLIAEKVKTGEMSIDDIDMDSIADRIYTAGIPDPDLVIRTSNELRISNFLLWQVSYSEFYLTKTLWPDFTVDELEKAIVDYSSRSRRMGDVKPQK